jgi:hypothetical protein
MTARAIVRARPPPLDFDRALRLGLRFGDRLAFVAAAGLEAAVFAAGARFRPPAVFPGALLAVVPGVLWAVGFLGDATMRVSGSI